MPLPLPCYFLETHEPILIIFGRGVTDKVSNKKVLYFPLLFSSTDIFGTQCRSSADGDVVWILARSLV